MTGYVPCPRDCHEGCPHNTAASGCPRILYEDRIVELENALAKAEARAHLYEIHLRDVLAWDKAKAQAAKVRVTP